MSNRAYLYNSSVLSNNPEVLEFALKRDGKEYIQIDGSAYQIPFAWLCCFRQSDLRPYTLKLEEDGSSTSRRELKIPVTTVESALQNLMACRPRYEKLTGNIDAAKEYWQMAVDAVKAFPFHYLTINIDEILTMGEIQPGADQFVEALTDSNDSIFGLDNFFTYNSGVLPYSLDDFYNKSSDELGHERDYKERTENSVTLDWFARGSPDHWMWRVRRVTPDGTHTTVEWRKSSKDFA